MKRNKLYYCNVILLLVMPLAVATGIILEVSGGDAFYGIENHYLVNTHIILSFSLALLVLWHLYLHWGWIVNWAGKFTNIVRKPTKWLTVLLALAVLSGIVAMSQWFLHGHSGIGSIHGKIGFMGGFLMIMHVLKRRKWYVTRFFR